MDRSRDSGNDPVTIGQGECVLERPTAILVTMPDGHGLQVDRWIPKSVVHDDSEVYRIGTAGRSSSRPGGRANRGSWGRSCPVNDGRSCR